MWIALKCKVCGIESADSDIDPMELEQESNIETDQHGQILEVCEDCI